MINYALRGVSTMTSSRLFSIGEISKHKRITKKALRFYEKIGLIKAAFINPSNRYRFYSIEQFILLDIIKAARAMDISPLVLRNVMNRKDMAELVDLLRTQNEKTAQKVEEMKRIIRRMDAVQNAIRHAVSIISQKNTYRRQIPKRHIITLEIGRLTSDADAIIEFSKFDRIIEENRLINAYETGMMFTSGGKSGMYPSRIFNAVETQKLSNTSIVSSIPAGNFVCVCYDKKNARKQNMKISRYLHRHGIHPKSILLVELLNDVFSADNHYFELQVPI